MIKEIILSLGLHVSLGIFLISKNPSSPPTPVLPPVMWVELKQEESEVTLEQEKTSSRESDIVEKIKKEKKKEEKVEEPEVKKISSEKGLKAQVEGNIPYSYYLSILLQKIGENWSFPLRIKGDTLRSIVYFVVLKKGNLTDIKIEEGSGDPIFDQSALRAVLLTAKLPPLPQELNMEFLRVHLEFQTP